MEGREEKLSQGTSVSTVEQTSGTRVPTVVVERHPRGNVWTVYDNGKVRYVHDMVLHAPEFRVHPNGHMIIVGLEAESTPRVDWRKLSLDGKHVKLPDWDFPVRYAEFARVDIKGLVWAA